MYFLFLFLLYRPVNAEPLFYNGDTKDISKHKYSWYARNLLSFDSPHTHIYLSKNIPMYKTYLKYKQRPKIKSEYLMANIHHEIERKYNLIDKDGDKYSIKKEETKEKMKQQFKQGDKRGFYFDYDEEGQSEASEDENMENKKPDETVEVDGIVFDTYCFVHHVLTVGNENEIIFWQKAVNALNAEEIFLTAKKALAKDLTTLAQSLENSLNLSSFASNDIEMQSNMNLSSVQNQYQSPQRSISSMHASAFLPSARQQPSQQRRAGLSNILLSDLDSIGNQVSVSNVAGAGSQKYQLSEGQMYALSISICKKASDYLNLQDVSTLMHMTNKHCQVIHEQDYRLLQSFAPQSCKMQLQQILKNLGNTIKSQNRAIWDIGVIPIIGNVVKLFSSRYYDFVDAINTFFQVTDILYSRLRMEIPMIKMSMAALLDVDYNLRAQNTDKRASLFSTSRMEGFRRTFDTFCEYFDIFFRYGKSRLVNDLHLAEMEAQADRIFKLHLLLGDSSYYDIVDTLYRNIEQHGIIDKYTCMFFFSSFFSFFFCFLHKHKYLT